MKCEDLMALPVGTKLYFAVLDEYGTHGACELLAVVEESDAPFAMARVKLIGYLGDVAMHGAEDGVLALNSFELFTSALERNAYLAGAEVVA